MSFNLMATVTISSIDFWNLRKNLSLLPLFPPSICHEVMGLVAMILVLEC